MNTLLIRVVSGNIREFIIERETKKAFKYYCPGLPQGSWIEKNSPHIIEVIRKEE